MPTTNTASSVAVPRFLGETLNLESHLIHQYPGTVISPLTVWNYLSNEKDVEMRYFLWAAVKRAFDTYDKDEKKITKNNWHVVRPELVPKVLDQLIIDLANQCWTLLPDAPHVTFIDPRLANDTTSMVSKARRLAALFKDQGTSLDMIAFTIPANDAGIRAAQKLLNYQIRVNLSLVSGLTHAAACAEAGPAAITIPITQILATHERLRSAAYEDLEKHPGIHSVNAILSYMQEKKPEVKTIGTGIGNLAEIGLLHKFDAIAISARQANTLKRKKIPIIDLERPRAIAKYPTGMLATKCGVISHFSSQSKAIYESVTSGSIARQQDIMEKLEKMVRYELELRFQDRIFDLETLSSEEREENKQKRRERKKAKLLKETEQLDKENKAPNARVSGDRKGEEEIF